MASNTESIVEQSLSLERIETHFQPILSLKSGRTLGYEALLRAYRNNKPVPPPHLFDQARSLGLELPLERRTRWKALTSFAGQEVADERRLLFLNFSSRLLDNKELDPGRIAADAREAGLEPSRIAIEIVESGVNTPTAIEEFARRNREAGFLITLDDFGTQHSNLERVALVRPEVIKIDRTIVSGASRDPYRRSVLRSVAYLARTVGALALAEGIEEYDDLLASAREGVDLAQGFLFGLPRQEIADAAEEAERTLAALLPRLREDLSTDLRRQAVRRRELMESIRRHLPRLGAATADEAEGILRQLVEHEREVECAFLVKPDGLQISETVVNPRIQREGRARVFSPAGPGESHALKDYVYGLTTLGQEMFLTDLYVSLASGRPCQTLSLRFERPDEEERLLCIDIAVDGEHRRPGERRGTIRR